MTFQFVHTDRATAPAGPYSLGVATDGLVLTAGQLGTDPGTGQVVDGGIKPQARQALENVRAVLEAGGSSLDRVIKLTVFLRDIGNLADVAEVRRELWADPHPTSTTVEISRLPHPDALLEIEAMAVR